ncbi:Mbov_0395 family pilin-like conjugal transfer protein [Spiroplasma endosymbiont of Sarcophaga carnaria]|uniref:Mbov_0395 family pilin-like conjugal transfer protein n=1 Tax=Spiroplasma endosymbiont of Sarcophaga carnaria TaxID=3066303 RepID=UPI0030D62F29
MKSNNTANFSEIIDVITLWSNIVFGVFLVIVVIFAIWKLIFILVSIMRSADSPEERANYLSALKSQIGAIISILVLTAIMNVVLQVIKTYNPSIWT